MTDKVLTDDEKNALLDGVASGAVEVQSGGMHKYADVQPFEISARSRIRKNSYPRLQVLNQHLAEYLAESCATSLRCETTITPESTVVRSFAEHYADFSTISAITTFQAAPLVGLGLIILESDTICQLVEMFFGGVENEPASNNGRNLSPGELAVCRLFGNAVLAAMQDVWEPLMKVAAERVNTEIRTELVSGIEDTEPVIGTRFEMKFADGVGAFSLLLPIAMVQPLIPVFDGQKRERDAVEDARWEKSIRARVPSAVVQLTGMVGQVRLRLRDLAGLVAGDVINIENPRDAVVLASEVPVMQGRFGVHGGRNAIEAKGWIDSQIATD